MMTSSRGSRAGFGRRVLWRRWRGGLLTALLSLLLLAGPETQAQAQTPVVSFASASQRAGEGSGTARAGSDYTALSGTVAVAAGATTASIPVAITDDTADESSETVVLQLDTSNARFAAGSPNRHTLTIEDDDAPLVVWFAAGSQRVGEGSGTRSVRVNLSPAPNANTTLNYTVGARRRRARTMRRSRARSWCPRARGRRPFRCRLSMTMCRTRAKRSS